MSANEKCSVTHNFSSTTENSPLHWNANRPRVLDFASKQRNDGEEFSCRWNPNHKAEDEVISSRFEVLDLEESESKRIRVKSLKIEVSIDYDVKYKESESNHSISTALEPISYKGVASAHA